MCGIAGIISFSNREEQVHLERMCNAMTHRGPDDSGIYLSPDSMVLLGHRRLSIIDLSHSARQPMCNEDNTIWITYNGEIYNYQELRRELDIKGHRFKSKSDTEVIIHGYEEWGAEGLLKRLRGMFAFGLYDSRPKGSSPSIFLARDRLGIKPLYYTIQDNKFIFASEIKAIVASGLTSKEIDLQSVALYLLYGSVPPPKTIYKKITSLEPGHYIVLSSTGLLKKRYYRLEEAFGDNSLNKLSEKEATQQVRSCLLDTIKCHLVSDVPVGAFLSGGIDSTAIVALMREAQHKQIKTVSVIFPDTPYDESKYARIAAKRFDTEHVEVAVTGEDAKNYFDRIFNDMDQPTVDGVNVSFVSRATAHAGLKVAMSGLGGDEIFCGYPTFRNIPRVYNLAKTIQSVPYANSIVRFFLERSGAHRLVKLSTILKDDCSLPSIYHTIRGIFSRSQIEGLLRQDLLEEALKDLNPFSICDNKNITDKVNHISFLETSCYMANQLLRDTDVFGMAHSLEVRVPFVDHILVELLAKIPVSYKYNGNHPKSLLIKALNHGFPLEVAHRHKMGFTFPFDLWMRKELRDFMEESLFSSPIYNYNLVKNLWSGFLNHRVHWARLWALTVLGRFLN